MIKTFYNSLFDTNWLAFQRNRLGRAWLYVIVFLGCLSLLATAVAVQNFRPLFLNIRDTVTNEVPDFQAQLRSGVLSVQGPQQWELAKADVRLMVDVRVTSTVQIANFQTSNTSVILLTSTTLSVFDVAGNYTRVVPLATYGEGDWTKVDLVAATNWGVAKGAPLLAVIFLVVFWLGNVIGKSLYAGLIALVLWLAMSHRYPSFKAAWSWRQVWTVSLLAITLPTIMVQAASWAGVAIPGLYTVVFVWLVYSVLRTPVVPVEPEKIVKSDTADTAA